MIYDLGLENENEAGMSKDSLPRIYADYNGWLRINGKFALVLSSSLTARDLEVLGLQLSEGMKAIFYTEDDDLQGNPGELQGQGIVAFDHERFGWLAIIDEKTIQHVTL